MILLPFWEEGDNDWGRRGGQAILFYSAAC